MGAATPAPLSDPGLSRADYLAKIEDYVKDSIVSGSADPVLSIIIDLVLDAEQRPLFFDPIREPYFFSRHVRRWILEGVKERSAINEGKKKLVESLTK